MRLFLAALFFLMHAEAGIAQELGRLFFTPPQREALDARRKARVPDKPSAAPLIASPTTRLDGYVRRSSGPSTVFVDGQALPEGSAEIPRIKPGQTLDRGSGEVRDGIGGGRISVEGRK
jgi:hypothetical protein